MGTLINWQNKRAKNRQMLTNSKQHILLKSKKRNQTEEGLNRTKPLDELEETYETLKRENEEDQRVIDDENATSRDKHAAAERIADRVERMERMDPQIQQREESLPFA